MRLLFTALLLTLVACGGAEKGSAYLKAKELELKEKELELKEKELELEKRAVQYEREQENVEEEEKKTLVSEAGSPDGKEGVNDFGQSTIKIGNLEVMTEDLKRWEGSPFKLKENWEAAKKACADLGDGWRLPTKEELNILYENRDKIGHFSWDYYWSSTDGGNSIAWRQHIGLGSQSYGGKRGDYYYIRAVRTLKR